MAKVFKGVMSLPLKLASVLFCRRLQEQDNDNDFSELEHFDATRYNVPITELPVEIISSIFEALTHEDHACFSRVSLVCRHWRAVALESPIAWTFITPDRYQNCSSGTALAEHVQRDAERVGTLPIRVDLDFGRVKSLRDVLRIMQMLDPHLARCYSFRAVAPNWIWMSVVAKSCGNMYDNLESIELQVNEDANRNQATRLSMFSGMFPRATSVTLVRTSPSCISPQARTPRLQKFHLLRNPRYSVHQPLGVTVQKCCSAFYASSVVENICLESVHLDYRGPDLYMPTVKVLRLGSLTNDSAERFFRKVFLPSLADIEVRIYPDDVGCCTSGPSSAIREGPVQDPQHFIVRGYTSTGDGDPCNLGLTALVSVPWLTSLDITASPRGALDASFFYALADWSEYCYPNMVSTRAKIPYTVPLQELHILTYSRFDPEVVVDLREYLGNNLTIRTNSPSYERARSYF